MVVIAVEESQVPPFIKADLGRASSGLLFETMPVTVVGRGLREGMVLDHEKWLLALWCVDQRERQA